MKKQIKYIAFYDSPDNRKEQRVTNLSATNKIDYICNSLNKNDYSVVIVSPSWTKKKNGYYGGSTKKINNDTELKTFATFGSANKIVRNIGYLFTLIQLLLYLLFFTKFGETIIVYHSIVLSIPIRIAKFIKRLNVILEVEEIYQDAQSLPRMYKLIENQVFSRADKYLFATELLDIRLNNHNKPSQIIYGTYKVEEKFVDKNEEPVIHVVYAGTFDARKAGVTNSIKAALYLPENYHVHIIGFGSDREVLETKRRIADVSNKAASKITYDGLLSGDEYIAFLQKCDIGLSTQTSQGTYNETSFPSKILSYMANGLKVVSVKIKVVEVSKIGKDVVYYDSQSPKAIAKAILSIDTNKKSDSRNLIRQLDKEFRNNIKLLVES